VSAQDNLRDLLAQLRAEIDATEAGSGNREELARLADQLDHRLNEEDHDGVVDELRDARTKFEVTHPRIAGAIGQVADALSALGL
jgi:hypothetical protein